ncbi:MAG TPA: hypothetical protein VM734_11400 [Kofleriaceae bacterium]|jgi:RNA polymerase sigma-70 factor (ECF subfamily)|nr:hypothetical protein [Kofleriaceae bacterium]
MADDEARDDREAAMRAACAAARWDQAATLVLGAYGQELVEYLVVLARSEADGGDAFSLFAERLWRGLPAFRWDASMRTWCYVLARRALADVKRAGPARRARLAQPLSETPELDALAVAVRTRTITFLRSEARDALAKVRAALDADDQELLVLRVDRKLPWRDVARIMARDDELDPAGLNRRAATLRKRFEVLKGRLRDAIARAR